MADSQLALSSERVSPDSQVAQGRTPLQTLPRLQLELDEVDRLPRAFDPPNIGLLTADRQSSQTQRKRLSLCVYLQNNIQYPYILQQGLSQEF